MRVWVVAAFIILGVAGGCDDRCYSTAVAHYAVPLFVTARPGNLRVAWFDDLGRSRVASVSEDGVLGPVVEFPFARPSAVAAGTRSAMVVLDEALALVHDDGVLSIERVPGEHADVVFDGELYQVATADGARIKLSAFDEDGLLVSSGEVLSSPITSVTLASDEMGALVLVMEPQYSIRRVDPMTYLTTWTRYGVYGRAMWFGGEFWLAARFGPSSSGIARLKPTGETTEIQLPDEPPVPVLATETGVYAFHSTRDGTLFVRRIDAATGMPDGEGLEILNGLAFSNFAPVLPVLVTPLGDSIVTFDKRRAPRNPLTLRRYDANRAELWTLQLSPDGPLVQVETSCDAD